MEESSETVRLQLRIGNKIFVANVTSNAIAEIIMLGEKSKVIEFLQKGVHDSIVMGKFQKQVEILDVSPLSNPVNGNNNNDSPETMEIEVSFILLGFFYLQFVIDLSRHSCDALTYFYTTRWYK